MEIELQTLDPGVGLVGEVERPLEDDVVEILQGGECYGVCQTPVRIRDVLVSMFVDNVLESFIEQPHVQAQLTIQEMPQIADFVTVDLCRVEVFGGQVAVVQVIEGFFTEQHQMDVVLDPLKPQDHDRPTPLSTLTQVSPPRVSRNPEPLHFLSSSVA